MEFTQVVEGRRAVKKYNPAHQITDETLKQIFSKVALTPSSFNLQHTRFVVVRDAETKSELRQAAYGQEQLETASAVIVVVGRLSAHKDALEIYRDTPVSVQQNMLPMIERFYADKPQLQRDEAIRSAGLAAMTLMLAAFDAGYATGPMIGFDSDQVAQIVDLDEAHIPAMLIVIGKQTGDLRPRPYRHPLDVTVRLEAFNGPGLT